MDLDNMTIEQVLDYCAEHDLFLLSLLIDCDGIEEVKKLMNDRLKHKHNKLE